MKKKSANPPRKSPVYRNAALSLGLLTAVLIPLLWAETGQEIRIVSGDQVHHLPSDIRDGVIYLPLRGIAAAFRGEIVRDSLSNNLMLLFPENRIQLSTEGTLLSVNGQVRALSAPVRWSGGDLWVPIEFVLNIIAPLHERGIVWSEKDRTFFITRVKPLLVEVDVAFSDRGARAILEFSRRPNYNIIPDGRRLVLSLEGSEIRIPFTRRDYDESSLRRIRYHRTSNGGEITFQAGRGFENWTYRAEESPFRLILEVTPDPESVLAERLPRVAEPVRERAVRPADPDPVDPRAAELQPAPEKDDRLTVIIDPGHGGVETGATSASGLHEKDLVLDVALRLRRHLEREAHLRVILTRDSDRDLGLEERTSLANHHKGDLFVSIHANASERTDAHGAETFFLSPAASDDDARRTAAFENDTLGLDNRNRPANDALKMILWDLAQVEFLAQSSELAESIQDELNQLLKIENRGIKQAPFRVLTGAAMPAVLVEIGFLSNPSESEMFRDADYKDRIAAAIGRSILRFRRNIERRAGHGGERDRGLSGGGS